jgi:hypothetical protein
MDRALNPVTVKAVHHHQNPSDSTKSHCLLTKIDSFNGVRYSSDYGARMGKQMQNRVMGRMYMEVAVA